MSVTSVLIAVANPAIRALAVEILAGAGVSCVIGDNPGEAVPLVRTYRPDGVLLAIGPSREGAAAARTIKAEWPETIVVLLTNRDEDALGTTGNTGVDALFPKEGFAISFALPGRENPLTVRSVVTWRNALWDRRALDLPPGCGLRWA